MKKKNNILFLFIILFSFLSYGQTDTIRIEKMETTLYRCGNKTALNWYICKSENEYFLANVDIPEDEVQFWFERYLNSQNIFRSKVVLKQGKEFFQFEQPNNPGARLYFEIFRRSNSEILTRSLETGEEFCFNGIEF